MSGIFAITRQKLATGTFNWLSGTYQACLISSLYTPDYENNNTFGNVPLGARLSPLLTLTNLTAAGGYCSADTMVWSGLTTFSPVAGVLVSQDIDGIANDNTLVFYIDQGAGFGITLLDTSISITPSASGFWRP